MNNFILINANISDCGLLFGWANDDEVRNNSFNSDEILYEEHCKWFKNKMHSNDTLINIIKDGQEAVGVIRLEKIDEVTMLISYSIDKKYRGKGYGTKLLELTRDTYPNIRLIGKVKLGNIGSIKAFKKAGYLVEEEGDYLIFYSKK